MECQEPHFSRCNGKQLNVNPPPHALWEILPCLPIAWVSSYDAALVSNIDNMRYFKTSFLFPTDSSFPGESRLFEVI